MALLQGHHDMLRATYHATDNGPVQKIGTVVNMDLSVRTLIAGVDEKAVILEMGRELQAGFDLENGPLFRALLWQKQSEDELLLVAHQLASLFVCV